jgi:hypothetical protein
VLRLLLERQATVYFRSGDAPCASWTFDRQDVDTLVRDRIEANGYQERYRFGVDAEGTAAVLGPEYIYTGERKCTIGHGTGVCYTPSNITMRCAEILVPVSATPGELRFANRVWFTSREACQECVIAQREGTEHHGIGC